MACWQMPHFYAIALYRLKDYQAAHIPVLPSVRSTETTRLRIIAYIIAFTLLSASLAFFANTGLTYVVVVVASGSFWLWQGLTNFRMKNTTLWARMMFKQSLVTMLVFSIALSIIAIAP
jgi:protoheme IX farnesyltransferase